MDMLKFRVVAGGHRKGRSLYRHKTSSPTVFTNCVFTIATIAHFECRAVFLHTGSNCYGFDELLEQLRVNFGDITIHRERTQDKSNCIRVSVRSFTNNVLEPSQHQTIIISHSPNFLEHRVCFWNIFQNHLSLEL